MQYCYIIYMTYSQRPLCFKGTWIQAFCSCICNYDSIQDGLAAVIFPPKQFPRMLKAFFFFCLNVTCYLINKKHAQKHNCHNSNMPVRFLTPQGYIIRTGPPHCHSLSHSSRTLHCSEDIYNHQSVCQIRLLEYYWKQSQTAAAVLQKNVFFKFPILPEMHFSGVSFHKSVKRITGKWHFLFFFSTDCHG